MEKCDLREILQVQPCIKIQNFLKENYLDQFHATRNASSYAGLRYWLKYVNCFIATYATTTPIRYEVSQFKNLKKLPRE